MVVVRLSRTALRKNVTIPTSHMSAGSRVVLIRDVMISNPLCASTTSTMVMAPIRKKTICAVPTSVSARSCPTSWSPGDKLA